MKLAAMPLGMVGANCYLVVSQQNRAAVIDPGGEVEKIFARLEQEGATPAMVLLTHGHFDHIAALWDFLDRYPVPVYLHAGDVEMLEDIQKALCNMVPLYFHYRKGADLRPLQDGDAVTLDECTFTLLHTPGHSRGSSCYRLDAMLFTGDTLFAGGVGRTDLYGGSWNTLCQSVARLAALEGDFTVYPGHGPSSTLARERRTNPYLEA